jgi:hypothetical protein
MTVNGAIGTFEVIPYEWPFSGQAIAPGAGLGGTQSRSFFPPQRRILLSLPF